MSIASLQSIVDQMSTDDLVEDLRDPPTAAKLRNALILAEALLVEPKAGQEQVSAVLEQDIERVASSMSNDDKQAAFVVTALRIDDDETKEVAVRDPRQEIYAAILLAFGRDQGDERGRREMGVWFGGFVVAEGETFEEHDIQDGARLTVRLPAEKRRATVREVAEEVHRLNPGVSVEALMSNHPRFSVHAIFSKTDAKLKL